ncbi:MAG: alpha/beta fold hydrolase [Gemmatimonadales bacterium]|nr:alpha/beta fold hydrolase [Gemmatimonadales bacterium]NIP08572.1 alpha/beta fold hydrolase [Gemmatimonadales bacterium]NIQ99109.1 alpha/beta fold hydrolase [Gemmatimonadales bacterium]NIS66079.1 alpha/beta fold hydrolase [Gemmatimonadales bacterium]
MPVRRRIQQQLRPRRTGWCTVSILLAVCSTARAQEGRETVLDSILTRADSVFDSIPQTPRWCDMLQLTSKRVDVGTAALYVEEEGEGTALVLLHGGPGATHHYFHPWFARAAEFARVIYVDQRGCGLSEYEPGPEGYSVDQAVEDLDALREELGFDKWVLLGHSYGGFLAQYYATRFPERVSGMVLVAASPGMWVRFRNRQYTRITREEMARIREVREQLREWATAGRIPQDELTALIVYNSFLNGDWKRQSFYRPSVEKTARIALYEWHHDPEGFRSQVGASQEMIDLRGAFAGSPIPTLIVEGEHDLTWSEDKPRILHDNHPGAELVVLDRAAHEPFADAPELFFAHLRSFIESLPDVPPDRLKAYQAYLAAWHAQRTASTEYLLRSLSNDRDSNRKLAERYSRAWLPQLSESDYYFRYLQRVGFGLYDLEQYDEALVAFQALQDAAQRRESQGIPLYVGLVWQGHVLDLQGKRAAAVERYREAAALNLRGSWAHPEFGMQFEFTPYAKQRMETPFRRIEMVPRR